MEKKRNSITIQSGIHYVDQDPALVDLLYQRDRLFNNYVDALEKYTAWLEGKVEPKTGTSLEHMQGIRKDMCNIIRQHMAVISKKLIDLDVQITKLNVEYQLAEVY